MASNNTPNLSPAEMAAAYKERLQKRIANPKSEYCPSGYDALDKAMYGGFFKSELCIIGARPGMGKTTFAINIIENILERDGTILFFSLDMPGFHIYDRMISTVTSIHLGKIKSGDLTIQEADICYRAIDILGNRNFYLRDGSMNVDDIAQQTGEIEHVDLNI